MSDRDLNERAGYDEEPTAKDRALEVAHEYGDRIQRGAQDLGDRARQYGAAGADYARRAGSSAGTFAAANALPLSLIGLGVGWLVLSARRNNAHSQDELYFAYDDRAGGGYPSDYGARGDYTTGRGGRISERAGAIASGVQERAGAIASGVQERAGAIASGVQERAGAIASTVQERAGAIASRAREASTQLASRVGEGYETARSRAGEYASQVGSTASQWSHDARDGLSTASHRTVEYADENPLLVGALAIAAGVGAGLALPATRRENALLGETRDRLLGDARGLIDEARRTALDAAQTAREAALDVGRQARETTQELRSAVTDPRISH